MHASSSSAVLALTLALLLLVPAPAQATAGFAERHSELRYNGVASLHWIHPGDGCDCGKFCFQVVRADSRSPGFRGLQRSLAKINVPDPAAPELIFAQSCAEGNWIVYDLAVEDYLIDTPSYDQALAVWKASLLAEPRFADAQHGARGLHQTSKSRTEGMLQLGFMWLPFLTLLVFPVCIVASLVLFARYRRTKRARDLGWALIVLVPTLPGCRVVWVVLSHMLIHRSA